MLHYLVLTTKSVLKIISNQRFSFLLSTIYDNKTTISLCLSLKTITKGLKQKYYIYRDWRKMFLFTKFTSIINSVSICLRVKGSLCNIQLNIISFKALIQISIKKKNSSLLHNMSQKLKSSANEHLHLSSAQLIDVIINFEHKFKQISLCDSSLASEFQTMEKRDEIITIASIIKCIVWIRQVGLVT